MERAYRKRQQERRVLTQAALTRIDPSVPRSLRRKWSRLAQKIARRAMNHTLEYPLTRKDVAQNARLRAQGMALDKEVSDYAAR